MWQQSCSALPMEEGVFLFFSCDSISLSFQLSLLHRSSAILFWLSCSIIFLFFYVWELLAFWFCIWVQILLQTWSRCSHYPLSLSLLLKRSLVPTSPAAHYIASPMCLKPPSATTAFLVLLNKYNSVCWRPSTPEGMHITLHCSGQSCRRRALTLSRNEKWQKWWKNNAFSLTFNTNVPLINSDLGCDKPDVGVWWF